MLQVNKSYGRNLIVPARRAKLDFTHPASQNLRFAGIAASGNFLNLYQGTRGTVNGSPTSQTNAYLGQVTNYGIGGATDQSTFSGQIATADPAITLAAIFMLTGTNGVFRTPFMTSNNGTTGWVLSVDTTSQLTLNEEAGGQGSSGIILSQNVPYFCVGSMQNAALASLCNFVVRRLDTGSIQTSAVTGAGSNVPNGTYSVGNDLGNARPLNGIVAAVHASATFYTIQVLVQWSEDPWGFWYASDFGPQTLTFPPIRSASVAPPPSTTIGVSWVM